MNLKTHILFLETVLLSLTIKAILAMPAAFRKVNYPRGEPLTYLEDDVEKGAMLEQALHKFLHNNEHKQLREMLKLAIRLLDDENDALSKKAVTEKNMITEDMPFYFDHIQSLVKGEASSDSPRRRHRKRSSFDSISHNGGLSGLGGTHQRKKLEFTFENLLPYLIREMRRTNRQVPVTGF